MHIYNTAAVNHHSAQVYLVLWWWYLFLLLVGLFRIFERYQRFFGPLDHEYILSRVLLLQSSWVRFQLMNLRMHRYFDDSQDIDALKSFFNNSSHGDWLVDTFVFNQPQTIQSTNAGSFCTR